MELLIVESPAKAKTIKKYLGGNFEVLASYGHVRDLVAKSGSVDTENDFAMKYAELEKNSRHVSAIAKATKNATALYLATDPDREGEGIAWHLCELLKAKKILKKTLPVNRVVFHEITKSAIQNAVAHPRSISMELVDAQQSRRALDYLVGFNLSPLLWKKIRTGLSAGRVQSPALRMIVEREQEIAAFKSQEYWTIGAALEFTAQQFAAKLIQHHGEKLHQFSITNSDQANAVKAAILKAAQGILTVQNIEKKQRKRFPVAPFITSSLQQEAARKLNFTGNRTMRVAQSLYEGVDIGDGSVGLITYMRTDATHLAAEAINEIRDFIVHEYGKETLPSEARIYKTKSKNAQEAHEAIRPTSINRKPDAIAKFLNPDQLKLYTLIWKRTLASQMQHALIDTVAIDLICANGADIFRANGSAIASPGFMLVYQESQDDLVHNEADDNMLPNLTVGAKVNLMHINTNQHFTEPPPRYSEASLIKALEEYGIGRPSTYAAIVSTLQDRNYVVIENKRFKPTDVGQIVNEFLTNYFRQYVDYDFTAKLEDKLDAIARGETKMLTVLKEFWQPFTALLSEIETKVQRKDVTQKLIDEKCPECGEPLSLRLGKNGAFIGCTAFPKCTYTRKHVDTKANNEDAIKQAPEVIEGRSCPNCQSPLHVKFGRYGKFIGCSKYPECKYLEPLEKPTDTGIECPACKKEHLLKRKSRYGKIFYSCAGYPKCKYAVWYEPLAESCPKCHWPILMHRITKRAGDEKVCPQKDCDYKIPMNESTT